MDWAKVQPLVAKVTRACSYDRAGYGWSGEDVAAHDSAHVASGLHELLARGGESGPYVLVGHSLGGLYVQAFSQRFACEVGAMVLVDPVQRRQSDAFDGMIGPSYERGLRRLTRLSALLAPTGLLRLARQPASVIAPRLPASVRKSAVAFSYADRSYQTIDAEMAAFRASQQAVRSAASVPTTLLVAADLRDYPPGFGAREKTLWNALQKQYANEAGQVRIYRVADSGHYIHIDQPNTVARAVLQQIDLVRTTNASRCPERAKD